MHALIIGGTGLISTATTRFLLERGVRVTHYNRGRTEDRAPAGAAKITGDRRDFDAFERQMREAGPFDCVIDMVCFQPEEAESVVHAFRGRIGQLVFCSTVDVYAKPADRYPYRENQPQHPLNDYGLGKSRCEAVLMKAHARGDFPVTLLRPAHTYGDPGTLIHAFGWTTTFLDRLRKGRPIIVHGDGTSLWASCHVDDVGRAFADAAGNARAFGRAYHVTGEEWLTWDQYCRTVAQAIGAPEPSLVHIPSRLLARLAPRYAGACADNFQFCNIFDNDTAREDLGFRQTVPLREGARRTYDWLEVHGRIEDADSLPVYDRVLAAWERLQETTAQEMEDG